MPEVTTSQTNSDYQKVSFTEFKQITQWVFKLMVTVNPVATIVYLVTSIISKLQDLVYTYLFAKIIDQLIQLAQQPNAHITQIYPYLVILLAYNIVETLISFLTRYSFLHIRVHSRVKIRQKLYTKLNSLGIQTLERPEINDKIHRANEYLGNIIPYLEGTIRLVADSVRLISSLTIFLTFLPFFTLILLVLFVPYLFFDKNMRAKIYKFDFENTEDSRKAGSSANDLTNKQKLEEISVTGVFNYFDRKYVDYNMWANNIRMGIFKKWRVGGHTFGLITDIVTLIGYVQIFNKLISQVISVGNTVFWMRSLNILEGAISNTMQDFNDLLEFSLQLKDTYSLFNLKGDFTEGTKELGKLEKGPEIEFENVTFTYPRGQKPVLNNISFKVRSGEKLAIVGHNGAGKTTAIKLISKFYLPTQGTIKINGIDIKDLNSSSLHENMGVLFQEFNLYTQLTVKENIAVGDTRKEVDMEQIINAAKAADAENFIEAYANKYDQVLSESYRGGVRPSTGQWQKIALARFFYRNSPLVIFDEPTASIDAVSEFNIFNQIYEFFKGKTVIIISHRFSTVRNADRIIVLDQGEIIEEGTHTQLMKLNGKYAQAFILQAQGYDRKDEEVTEIFEKKTSVKKKKK